MADSRTFLFSNNATAALAADITNVQTTITLAAGKGALFPSPGALQLAKITVQNLVTGAFEVMNCTTRAGDVLTVERGSEGTTGQAFTAATAIVQLRITRETLEKLQESPVAGAIAFNDLTDVVITAPVSGHTVVYNGTNWVNAVPASGSPTDASYVVLGLHAGLSAERALAVDAPITLVDGGANGNVTLGLAADGVTFAKMQNIATASFIGRITAATGDPENLTATQATSILDLFTSALKGLVPGSGGGTTSFLRADGTWAAPSSGVPDGDKGDITVSASGATWTIDNDAVTYAKMQNVSNTSRVLGRITAGAGNTEELTGGQVTTLLDTFTTALKGVAPASGGGTINFLRADGTWAAPPNTLGSDGDKGDVTVGGTGTTLIIDNDAVTYAKMQNVSATSRFLGRITAGAGDTEELTGSQVTTLLDTFTTSLKGVAPASGGGTTNFLRADGTWAAPTASITFNGALVSNSAVQSISASTTTILTGWDTESYDTNSWHDNGTNPSRMTVPSGVSFIRVSAMVILANIVSDARGHNIAITKNGAGVVGGGILQQDDTPPSFGYGGDLIMSGSTAAIPVTAGDYFEVTVFQSSGGAVNVKVNSWFGIEKVA